MHNWQPTSSMQPTTGKFDVNQWDDFISNRISENTENLYEESSGWTNRHLLMQVLRHTHGNQLHAARILGISRATLRSKVRRVGIRVDEINW
jgi:DNA-binding protein Fis